MRLVVVVVDLSGSSSCDLFLVLDVDDGFFFGVDRTFSTAGHVVPIAMAAPVAVRITALRVVALHCALPACIQLLLAVCP